MTKRFGMKIYTTENLLYACLLRQILLLFLLKPLAHCLHNHELDNNNNLLTNCVTTVEIMVVKEGYS